MHSAEERSSLELIDGILRTEEIRTQIQPIVQRVRGDLRRKPKALMTWEPIPLDIFGRKLPEEIRSAWVFVLRAGSDTGAERHPNSHQRMMSFQGTGDMRTPAETVVSSKPRQTSSVRNQSSEPPDENHWQTNILISDHAAPLQRRWISIPPNMWHRPVVSKTADWVVVSFHTVPAEELIEERADSDRGTGTKQMKYLARN